MKANPLQTLWLMVKSAYVFTVCMNTALYLSFRHRFTREIADVTIRKWARGILSASKTKCQVFNPHQVQFTNHHPYIIMVNHSSLYDIPITYAALPGTIRMLGKKELLQVPILGRTMRAMETPTIDRKNREQAIKDLAQARQLMEEGVILWICPEGTRSRDGKLLPLKKGGFIIAIESKATIIPVGIRNANKILPAKTWHFHLNQEVEVHIGEPIDTAQYSVANKEELIARVGDELKQLADL